ncbi:hypothetical protein C8P63_1351, partial [Melghirimyces profundicolus]
RTALGIRLDAIIIHLKANFDKPDGHSFHFSKQY